MLSIRERLSESTLIFQVPQIHMSVFDTGKPDLRPYELLAWSRTSLTARMGIFGGGSSDIYNTLETSDYNFISVWVGFDYGLIIPPIRPEIIRPGLGWPFKCTTKYFLRFPDFELGYSAWNRLTASLMRLSLLISMLNIGWFVRVRLKITWRLQNIHL